MASLPRDANVTSSSGPLESSVLELDKAEITEEEKTVVTDEATSAGQQVYKSQEVHSRRTGAMSVQGQLYETKLLTFFLLRLLNYNVQFYLGANITGVGALDDLCFKYKPANSDRHVTVFLQAKHKSNPDKGKLKITDVQSYDGDFSVQKHFDSYLMIRQKFTSKSEDVLVNGTYHDSLCYFVVYTPLNHNVEDRKPLEENETNNSVKDLIQTSVSGDIFQLDYKHGAFLTKQLVEKNIRQLGKLFLSYISKENVRNMMDDKLVKAYHVVIMQNVVEVINVAEIVHRYKFRSEFFESKDRPLTIFRESLYDEAVNNKTLQPTGEDQTLLVANFLKEKPTADSISKLIGTVVKYDQKTNNLVLLSNKYSDKEILSFLKVGDSVIRDAINIKGKILIQSLEFTLPAGFGNTDLTLKGNMNKIERRLDFLATNLEKLFQNAKYADGTNVVLVDESMVGPGRLVARGVVEHDGGLGSALGNLLVVDRDTGALKFNTSSPLPKHADMLWNKLKKKHDEDILASYRLKFCVDGFPKTSFHDNSYEEYLVKDFIGQYWLCTGQAKEDEVECKVKRDINKLLKIRIQKKTVLRVKSDAVFLMLHDKVQKWWMLPDAAEYLTESNMYLHDAIAEVAGEPLLSLLNHICVKNLRHISIEFDDAAVESLGLDEVTTDIVLIVTDSVSLTTMKLIQHYNTQTCTFIDFNYATSLLYPDLAHEAASTNIDALIIICEATDIECICEALAQFIEDVPNKKVTVVADAALAVALKQELTCAYHEVRDDRNSLIDLSPNSQEKILNSSKVVYQDEYVFLKAIIGDESRRLITSKILQNLVNKDVITIGRPLDTPAYNNMKQFYIERYLSKSEIIPSYKDVSEFMMIHDDDSDEERFYMKRHELKTLKDLDQNTVVVTAPPGMGKSILMTHLSLETKKMYPNVWIARINLLEHSNQFQKWQHNKTTIGRAETFSFLCQAVTNGATEYVFKNKENEVILETDGISHIDLLQAELFMNYVKDAEVIFIFDGFDEICPLYEREVIQLMKATATSASSGPRADTTNKPKVWIASRSYNNVKLVIEREFGVSYGLEPLSAIDQRLYLEKYWKQYMKVDEFNHEQFLNVNAFMEHMKDFSLRFFSEQPTRRILIKPIHVPLHNVFIIAAKYFQDGVNSIALTPALKSLTEPWRQDLSYSLLNQIFGQVTFREYSRYENAMSGSPLHTHIAAEYLQSEIQHNLVDRDSSKWDLDTNTFSLYKHFLETKLTKIRFEEKNRIDVSKPDSKLILDREKVEFIDMHRMLGVYALFKDDIALIMPSDELGRVKSMVEDIKFASEKTGVIDCIVDDVPVFVHRTFAEYFAADYICEALKSAFAFQELGKQEAIWEFILYNVILRTTLGVSSFVDFKLFNDESLKASVTEERTENMVLTYLLYQAEVKLIDDYFENSIDTRTALDCSITRRLKSTAMYLLQCCRNRMESEHSKIFIDLVQTNRLLWIALAQGYEDFVEIVLEIVREMHESRLHDVTKGERFSFSLFTNYSEMSNTAIIRAMSIGSEIMLREPDMDVHVTVSEGRFGTFYLVKAFIDAPQRHWDYFSRAIDLN